MHAEKCVQPVTVANKVDVRKKESKNKNYIGLSKGNCPLTHHGNHNISDCNMIKLLQAQLLFLKANSKSTGNTYAKPSRPFVKRNFAIIAEITMQDLEEMQTEDVLVYASEVQKLMPTEEISAVLPALVAFDSHTGLDLNSDDDNNDIAIAYAMEYASSDDVKA